MRYRSPATEIPVLGFRRQDANWRRDCRSALVNYGSTRVADTNGIDRPFTAEFAKFKKPEDEARPRLVNADRLEHDYPQAWSCSQGGQGAALAPWSTRGHCWNALGWWAIR